MFFSLCVLLCAIVACRANDAPLSERWRFGEWQSMDGATAASATNATLTCFDDGECVDLRQHSATAADFKFAATMCEPGGYFGNTMYMQCVEAKQRVAVLYGNDARRVLPGLVVEMYARGFAYAGINEQMRSGAPVAAAVKPAVLALAGAMSVLRRNPHVRAFEESRDAEIVFRGQPPQFEPACAVDHNQPGFSKQTDRELINHGFASSSLSRNLALTWSRSSSILVIARNTSASTSGRLLWPVSTISQAEILFSPGHRLYSLGCFVRNTTFSLTTSSNTTLSFAVAFALYYDGSELGHRLSDVEENALIARILSEVEQQDETCYTAVCAQTSAAACVDAKTLVPRAAMPFFRPQRIATCNAVLHNNPIHPIGSDCCDYSDTAAFATCFAGRGKRVMQTACDRSDLSQVFRFDKSVPKQSRMVHVASGLCVGRAKRDAPVRLVPCSSSAVAQIPPFELPNVSTNFCDLTTKKPSQPCDDCSCFSFRMPFNVTSETPVFWGEPPGFSFIPMGARPIFTAWTHPSAMNVTL